MSKKPSKKESQKFNLYQVVTDRIIASLKAGVIPWEKARKTPHYAGGPFPRNVYICVELAWLEDEDQSQIF